MNSRKSWLRGPSDSEACLASERPTQAPERRALPAAKRLAWSIAKAGGGSQDVVARRYWRYAEQIAKAAAELAEARRQ